MSLFKQFKADDVKIEETKDILGGGSGPLDTDVYPITFTGAYVDYSRNDAMSINLTGKTPDGTIFRNQQWVSSGKAKGCKNYYVDRNGKNQYLPGFSLVDDICQLALDAPLSEVETEEKAVSIYDYDLKKEVSQMREVIVDLIGQTVLLAIEKQTVDKNVKNDATGNYEPSGETREQNEVIKAFHPEHEVTVTEAKAGLREATFLTQWVEKNKGKVRNKAKGASEGGAKAGAPAAAAPAKSLFT